MKVQWDFSEFTEFADRLGDVVEFEKSMRHAAKNLSKALLKRMKSLTPVDTYELINGWDGNNFAVRKNGDRFEVLIVNTTPYASAVNDGHVSKNQFGGPYRVHHRVQVRSAHKWQQGDPTYYVFGHFFVERGILQMSNTEEIEQIIFNELTKWWDRI